MLHSPRATILYALAALLLTTTGTAAAVEVTFRFRAPEGARLVTVAGTFNNWNSTADPMQDGDGDGVFELTLPLTAGTYQYKFVVNGTDWYHDEHAGDFVPDGFGGKNSVLQVGEDALTAGEPAGAGHEPAGIPVTLRFRWEHHANSVSLAGTFNGWDAAADPMNGRDGVWEITLHLAPGEYWYQFVIDGERWIPDPDAAVSGDDGFGGRRSRLVVTPD